MRGGRVSGAGAVLGFLNGLDVKVEPPKVTDEQRQGIVVRDDATKGTAQFIGKYRRQLHQHGAVEFELPRGAFMPPWLAVVLEMLRLRPKQWRIVELQGKRGALLYRVVWRGWLKTAKRRGELPSRLG